MISEVEGKSLCANDQGKVGVVSLIMSRSRIARYQDEDSNFEKYFVSSNMRFQRRVWPPSATIPSYAVAAKIRISCSTTHHGVIQDSQSIRFIGVDLTNGVAPNHGDCLWAINLAARENLLRR